MTYVLSRMEWYCDLVPLLLKGVETEPSTAGLRYQLKEHIVQLYEKLLSYQIKSVCLYGRHRAAVIARDVVKMDDWAGQHSEIEAAEAIVKRDIEMYNSEHNKQQLRNAADAARDLEANLQNITSSIERLAQQQEDRYESEEYKKCLRDLCVTDPREDKERIQETKGGLFWGSYNWIIGHVDYKQFCEDRQKRMLWIKGDPGKGKTMLLCGMIDELRGTHDKKLAYFFCQATHTNLNNAVSILRGLMYLLISKQPTLISCLQPKYDVMGEKLFQSINAWGSLVKILTDMLRHPALTDAVLVVDALDECRTDRPRILDFIIASSSDTSSSVKWIISSRNFLDIEEKLDMAERKVRLSLELNAESVSTAVDTYIEHKVAQLARTKKYDPETSAAVQDYLTLNASGTFLWVALVCLELAHPNLRKWQTLDKLQSFPPGLDSLYAEMMKHVSNSDDAELFKNILAIASTVYRPVTLDELGILVEPLTKFNRNYLPDIIQSCGSFLTLREGVVSFVHQSAKDFLLNKESDHIVPFGIANQHHALFSRSLTVLSSTLQRDIYSLEDPGFPSSQVSPPSPDRLAAVHYACVYWADHLDGSTPMKQAEDLKDEGPVHEFIKRQFLHWLESLSLLRCVNPRTSLSDAVTAIYKLEALLVRLMRCDDYVMNMLTY